MSAPDLGKSFLFLTTEQGYRVSKFALHGPTFFVLSTCIVLHVTLIAAHTQQQPHLLHQEHKKYNLFAPSGENVHKPHSADDSKREYCLYHHLQYM
jgi:hypothetical protein